MKRNPGAGLCKKRVGLFSAPLTGRERDSLSRMTANIMSRMRMRKQNLINLKKNLYFVTYIYEKSYISSHRAQYCISLTYCNLKSYSISDLSRTVQWIIFSIFDKDCEILFTELRMRHSARRIRSCEKEKKHTLLRDGCRRLSHCTTTEKTSCAHPHALQWLPCIRHCAAPGRNDGFVASPLPLIPAPRCGSHSKINFSSPNAGLSSSSHTASAS